MYGMSPTALRKKMKKKMVPTYGNHTRASAGFITVYTMLSFTQSTDTSMAFWMPRGTMARLREAAQKRTTTRKAASQMLTTAFVTVMSMGPRAIFGDQP